MSEDRTTIRATKALLNKVDLYIVSSGEFSNRSEFFREAAHQYINRKGHLWLSGDDKVTIQLHKSVATVINAYAVYDNIPPESEIKVLIREALQNRNLKNLQNLVEAAATDKNLIATAQTLEQMEKLNRK